VTKKTLQTKTSTSLPQTQQQQLKNNLHNWLATFPLTSPLPNSYQPLSTKHRHRLAQWPQSQQLPLSLQQLYWAELLDLQYPLTPSEVDRLHQDLLEEEADIGQVEALLWVEDHQDHPDLRTSWRRGKSRRIWKAKLVGREPEIFDGTRSKTEGFLQEWNIYYGLNWGADVITTPFTRAMLFLSFIKGPNIQEWVAAQIEWLGDQLAGGAQVHNEYLWRTIIDRFKDAFTDTMSIEKAEHAIKEICMKDGDLDGYIAKFEQLARISGHDLNAKGTWTMFAEGLPKMLHYNMISQGGRHPNSWQEWTEGVVEQQQKWLYLQTFFNGKVPQGKVPQNKQGPNQNWRQGQGSGSVKNSNAMDLTPGHIRARGALTDEERAKLMATGGCFRCRKQGHMSRNCPDKPRQSQARGNQEEDVQIQATSTKKPFDAKGLIEQIKELNDEDKDVVIQEVFMKNRQDFS
jgi:hypothetical protein